MKAKFDDQSNLLIRLEPEDRHYTGLASRLRAFQVGGVSAMLSVCQFMEEPEPADISAFFAYDIHNRRVQGILNKTTKAAKKLSEDAKVDLEKALKADKGAVGEAILKWLDKYRLQLAKLLTTSQLASLLEGAKEVAEDIPALATFPGAVPPPPSLEPKEAVELIEKLVAMTVEERSKVIYDLPEDQQTYAQQAVHAREAGGVDVPPPVTPPGPPTDTPEGIHFPTIDEAVRLLSEKNVLTKDKFDALDAAMRAKSFTVANVSAEETLTKIRDVLAENVKEGVSYEAFTDKIMEDVGVGTFMSEGHMENVFRTNIQSVFSDGQMAVINHPLVRSGFPYARQDAIHDTRVEDTHLAVETIGIQGTNIFRINDPVFETFRAPWRWNCVLPGNFVQGRVIAASKALYSGEVVELFTAKGTRLSLTVNHPVLTKDGPVPAGEINEGDDLLSYSAQQEVAISANVQQSPTLIEDIFNSFSSPGFKKVCTGLDLHGDGEFIHGEVEVVYANLLMGERIPSKREGVDQFVFMPPDDRGMCCRDLTFSLLGSHPTPLHNLGSTLVADGNPVFKESGSDTTSVYSKTVGDDLLRFPSYISLADGHFIKVKDLKFSCFGLGSELDVTLTEPSSDGSSLNSNFLTELFERFPGKVAPDKVVKVVRYHYSGPVYDLETEPGYYTCSRGQGNAVLIQNCRCGWRAMTVRQAAEKGITEAQEWLETGVEPTPPAFVSMPDFQPPPGFQRSIGSMPLSIRLSMESVMVFAFNPNEPRDELGEWTTGGKSGQITDKEAESHYKPVGSIRLDLTKVKDKSVAIFDSLSTEQKREVLQIAARRAQDLGLSPANYEMKKVAVKSIIPSQTGEDRVNASSRNSAETIASGNLRAVAKADIAPIVLDASMKIVDGNHRHAAAELNGQEYVYAMVPRRIGLSIGKKPEEETDESLLMAGGDGGGSPATTGAGDTAREPPAGRRVTKLERKPNNRIKIKRGRSVFKKPRVKKKWSASVALALDQRGIDHKGKGREGGGQFTRKGVEDTDVARQPSPGPSSAAGGPAERGDVQPTDAASSGVEGQVSGSSDAGVGQGGKDQNKSVSDQPAPGPRPAPTTAGRAIERLDKLGQWAQRTGKSYITNWLSDLKDHIAKFGVESSLEQLGGPSTQQPREPVAYDPGEEYPKGWNESVRAYLSHYGIINYYDSPPEAKVISSITKKAREDLPARPEGRQVEFEPAESGLTDKLKEAKHLPGLESSEDINVLMGRPVTHINDEVVAKLDEYYGKGAWIIKPYTEDAFAGHGIYFPERVAKLHDGTKQAIWGAEKEVGKLGLSVIRDQKTGSIAGFQDQQGDYYQFNTPEYKTLLERAKRNHPSAKAFPEGHWLRVDFEGQAVKPFETLERLGNADKGIPFLDHEGEVTNKGFMAQPAFPAVAADVRNRTEGMPYANTEARAHIFTKNGQANLVPYATFYKKRPFPIVFQDKDSQEIERVAREAVMALPESERQGHVYAPDVIKTADGYKVVELNPSNEVGSSGHLGSNPLIIDSYVSHIQGREPGFVQFIKRTLTQKQKALSVDIRGEAHKGKGRPDGGQFTSKGIGEDDISVGQRTSRQNTAAAAVGSGQRSSESRSRSSSQDNTGRTQETGAAQPPVEPSIKQIQEGLVARGVKPLPDKWWQNKTGEQRREIWAEHGRQILKAASELGILVTKEKVGTSEDEFLSPMSGNQDVGGAEHEAYADVHNKRFYKFTRSTGMGFGLNKDIYSYLQRIEMSNTLWPNLGYRFEGIVEDYGLPSFPQIAFSMSLIHGTRPEQKEVHDWFRQKGWEPSGPPILGENGEEEYLSWRDPQSGIVAHDAHEGNFIKTAAGLAPIDIILQPRPANESGPDESTRLE